MAKRTPWCCAARLILVVAILGAAVPVSGRQPEDDGSMRESTNTIGSAATKQSKPAHTNRLAGETSPYLLQHAHNPVDWYPWGEEALTRAKTENKPIFLSIGYSACHWCHVMERESFEDPEVARILGANFISIKVDREERPDLDEIYMRAVQLMTGSGGWPLTVFLTPDLEPFFGGTYFPPVDGHGRPGFKRLLEQIATTWRENPEGMSRRAAELTGAIRDSVERETAPPGAIDVGVLSRAVQHLARTFDAKYGGFGRAPKFPPSGAIGVLLRQNAHTGEKKLLEMARTTLDRMAYGGMYDQLGGGFHRYSTDERWLVPHFEKMLYDNALLARAYLEASQATGEQLYRRVAREILDYVLRDMADPSGGFHSSEDADSEGEEGKFYVWKPEEVKAILGAEDGAFFCDYYGVTDAGNLEGHSILHVAHEPREFADGRGISLDQLDERLIPLRRKLLATRDARVRPGKDDKIIAAWNGMMISALARGYQVLGEDRYRLAAEGAADFILATMVRDGALLRIYRDRGDRDAEGASKQPGYLDDYAEMIVALIDLYEATFDLRWLEAADLLARRMVEDFWDVDSGGFFYTSASHKNLIVRTMPYYDGAVPSGNATAAIALLRLSGLLGDDAYRAKAEAILRSAQDMMVTQPRGHLNLLCAVDFFLHPTREIAIAGKPDSSDTGRLMEIIHSRFIPNKVLALVEPGAPGSAAVEKRIPLLRRKKMNAGRTTVYVCRNRKCKLPVTDGAALAKILDEKAADETVTNEQPAAGRSGVSTPAP